jgi:hypothetical protein
MPDYERVLLFSKFCYISTESQLHRLDQSLHIFVLQPDLACTSNILTSRHAQL